MADKIFGHDKIAFAALGPITEEDVDLGLLALSGKGH
jgi:hypothetical protein